MTKKIFTLLAFTLTTLTASAQENKWFQDLKLSGYGMVQYQASDKENDEQNTFNLRLVRVALDGRAHDDFSYKLKMQVNGNTREGS
ncbi:MAG: porin, partial [Prevotella sp.]|nr:porin [Prevotella sp.]